MANMRTLAVQVPEDLFQKIKDYLRRNNMTQKEFVIGLIESEIERDLTAREEQDNTSQIDEAEAEENLDDEDTVYDEIEDTEEETEDEYLDENEDKLEDEADELDEDEEETEGMSMGM